MSDAPNRLVVLVVEDEPLLRMAAVDVVEEAGFAAIDVATADEAIAVLEARNDIHILFTDINMPGSLDGLKLARAVRDRWPPIHIIITSGNYSANELPLPERCEFFPKPYAHLDVIAALHRLAG